MALYIRDEAVRDLARRVAEARRTTVTEAVRHALEREVDHIENERAARDLRMRELFAKWKNEPAIQEWGDEQMYDEFGCPK
jgi:hypothetical protein